MSLIVLMTIGIVVVLILIILVVWRRNHIQHDDDPLEERLAEFSQREEPVSLEELELSQPFIERVVIPFLRKLRAEGQSKPGSLLKRIEQGQSDTNSASSLSTLQARRVSEPAHTTSDLELKVRVQNKLLAKIDPAMDISKTDEVNHVLQSLFEKILVDENIVLSRPERARLFKQIMAEILGLHPFHISISCPRSLSKKYEATFLIQIFLPKESAGVEFNVTSEFQNQEVHQLVTTSELNRGDKIKVKLFHPDFQFSEPVTKNLHHSLNKIVILGKPKDTCEPGLRKVLVSILDAETEQELESFTFTANVVDFAFGKISRPLLSRVSAVVFGIGSCIMFMLALLEQIDKTIGLTSGTAAGVLTLVISTSFYNSYQRIRPITS